MLSKNHHGELEKYPMAQEEKHSDEKVRRTHTHVGTVVFAVLEYQLSTSI